MSISIYQNRGQNFKGRQLQEIKKGVKHGNSGPENFVHPSFKISGSTPDRHYNGGSDKGNLRKKKKVLQVLAFEKTGVIVALNEPGRTTTINSIFF